MTNMAMRANPAKGYPGRTYRFYTGPTIHPFGHGLSYTKFTHTLAHAPAQLSVRLTGHHAATPPPSTQPRILAAPPPTCACPTRGART
jgi:hypothetical protein